MTTTLAPTSAILALCAEYQAKRHRLETLHASMLASPDILGYLLEGHRYAKPVSLKAALAGLNAEYWDKAMRLTDILNVMPQSKRTEWNDLISEKKTPDFDEQVVKDTLLGFLSSRAQLFAEKVDGIFQALSGAHVTNRPEGFGKKMIYANVYDTWCVSHQRVGIITDLRQCIAKVLGRDEPKYETTERIIKLAKSSGEAIHCDGNALKIRVYQIGTAHIEVHPDVAYRLNEILASLYPRAIPPKYRAKPRTYKDHPLLTVPIDSAMSEMLTDLEYRNGTVSLRRSYDRTREHMKQLNDLLCSVGFVPDGDGWMLDGSNDPMRVINHMITTGTVPEDRSHQFYATPEALAREAIDHADIQDGMSVLEPSAGLGAIADIVGAGNVQCVEVSALRAEVLRSKGHHVDCADFIRWAETAPKFDRIVMNPPFSNGRWQAHIEAARGLLKPGGKIIAILPSTASNHPGVNVLSRHDGAFDKTGVSVVIVEVE